MWQQKLRSYQTSFSSLLKRSDRSAGEAFITLRLYLHYRLWHEAEGASVHRHLEEKITESERRREEMERQMADLQEENEQLQKAQLSESEAKNKLRQETSHLTAENMVCVKGHAQDYICDYVH